MNEKQQQLTFDKGITNVPSDAICSDNTLEESVGMIYDDGEHTVIQKPVVKMSSAVYDSSNPDFDNLPTPSLPKILYVHKFNNTERYIANLDRTIESGGIRFTKRYLVWGTLEDTTLTIRAYLTEDFFYNDTDAFTSVGKTLIANMIDGLHYFLWKEDSYLYLGETIPTQKVSFWMGNNNDQYVRNGSAYEGIIDDGHVAYGKVEEYSNLVIGLYSKNKKAVANKKGFCHPFLIRTALQLYDGTYTNISQPMMLFPSVRRNSLLEQPIENSAGTAYMKTFYQKLYYRNESFYDIQHGLGSLYENWTDIVKDIVVFITDGVEIYDLSVEQGFRTFNDGVPSSVDIDRVCLDTVTGSTMYTTETERGYSALVSMDETDIESELTSLSVFYRLFTIGLFEKDQDPYYGKAENKILKHTLENLTTLESLENDDYFSHCKLRPDVIYAYNSRLNIASVERSIFEGFDDFYPTAGFSAGIGSDYTGYCRFYVTIQTDDGERLVLHEAYTLKVQGLFFYYPDSRAKHVEIYREYGQYHSPYNPYHRLLDVDLKEHEGLNGAYYYKGLPTLNDDIEVYNTTAVEPQVNERYEKLANYVITSEVNNPFLFKAEGYNAVGTGKIIGMSTLTQALSQGQFGQYPLLVFSESGIWAMSVSNTGLFQAIHPMSREVCNNAGSITQTDGAVFFTSEKGLMVVVGSDVKCVSEQLSGLERNFTGEVSMGNFRDYMKDCFIAYDYRDSLLWIFNNSRQANNQYCYVYAIKTGTFGKYQFSGAISNVVNNYPDYLLQSGSTLFSLTGRENINLDTDNYTGLMITRPMKLENGLALKSLMQIRHIKDMQGTMTMRIYASNNLTSWTELHSLRGMPWKYYRFRYDFAGMKATDRFTGTMLITQERRTDKLR